ncbi:c-type cytochrome [Alphaproteobacteria bacterium]|nr:c-type cytochrome [Alphaproteobacteria bacterium]
MRNIALTFLSLAFALAAAMPSIADDIVELRPDDPVYVKLGQKIYMDQCASCHGVNLEGQVGWRDTKVDGMRLAPAA